MTNVFYPGLVSEAEQRDIRSSSVWPLVIGINSIVLGELTAGRAVGSIFNGEFYVPMYTSVGEQALRIFSSGSKYHINARDTSKAERAFLPVLSSNNQKYLLNRLAEDRTDKVMLRKRGNSIHSIGRNLYEFMDKVDDTFYKALWATVNYYLSSLYTTAARVPSTVTSSCIDELLDLYSGKIEIINMTASTRRTLDAELAARAKRDDAIAEVAAKVRRLFGSDKWLVRHTPEGVIVGSVNLTAVVDHYCNSKNMFNQIWPSDIALRKAPLIVDVALYNSLADIPPGIKGQLYSAMTFAKVALGYQTSPSVVDPDALLPEMITDRADLDVGVYKSSGWHLFDK